MPSPPVHTELKEHSVEARTFSSDKGGYAVDVAPDGTLSVMRHGGSELRSSLGSTYYELNGQQAEAKQDGDGFLLQADGVSARLSIAADTEFVVHATPGDGEELTSWSMTIAMPLETQFHLAEHVNTGRMLDRSMPPGEFYTAKLTYNMLVAGEGGLWLRFMSRRKPLHKLEVNIERHPQNFLLTTTWRLGDSDTAADDARIGFFGSLADALDDHRRVLREDMHIVPFTDRHDLPAWIHNVQLKFTVDMMRSHGEVSHTFAQVTELVEALHAEGCPKDTVFRLPGWSGPFDSLYPTYRPHPGLGTEEDFRTLVDTIHRCGYRVMLHTLGWGIDPYHPDIDTLMSLVGHRKDGSIAGYKIADDGFPPTRRIHYRSGRCALKGMKADGGFVVETGPVPCLCESTLTIGGLKGAATRIRASIRERSQKTTPGCFAADDTFRFPFPFLLGQGTNRITLEVLDGEEPDWDACWYTIDHCFVAKSFYLPSTRPILKADTGNDTYIELYLNEFSRLVDDYGADAVYVDATTYSDPPNSRRLYDALAERFPHVPIGGEWCDNLEELCQWTFCFGAKRSLIDASTKLNEPRDAKSGSITRGIEQRFAWLNNASPACGFVRDHIYFHCAPDAFVDVGTVVDMNPKWRLYTDPEELLDQVMDSERLGFLPVLKVNFADYGIDEYTKRFVQHLRTREEVTA